MTGNGPRRQQGPKSPELNMMTPKSTEADPALPTLTFLKKKYSAREAS